MRFVSLDSRFTFHTSSPRSVTLAQLCFPSLAVVSLREDLHLQDRAHAGHTSGVKVINDPLEPLRHHIRTHDF